MWKILIIQNTTGSDWPLAEINYNSLKPPFNAVGQFYYWFCTCFICKVALILLKSNSQSMRYVVINVKNFSFPGQTDTLLVAR